ncbi:MAG TPA: DUF4129 domain-containing protein, partial [Candidatus Methylacidiphilales bacterium]|nr:DUF4129 domain-containing protein [Candidatus Methylacidiphilales bacterium]
TLAAFPYAEQLHRFTYFIMWGILVGVFLATGYWVWKVLRMAQLPLDQIRRTAVGTRFFAVPESYDPRINQAVTSGAWGEAVLYRWRKFLSALETRDLVKADRTQTNWEYVNQLLRLGPAEPTRELLLDLAKSYDLFIYGETPLSEPDWKSFREHVDEAEQQLNRMADSRIATAGAAGNAGSSAAGTEGHTQGS